MEPASENKRKKIEDNAGSQQKIIPQEKIIKNRSKRYHYICRQRGNQGRYELQLDEKTLKQQKIKRTKVQTLKFVANE